MTFTRNWVVEFLQEKVRIVVVDSLSSGSGAIGGMEGARIFEIEERVDVRELRGRYEEEHKRGSFRMLKAEERRIVK